MPIRILVIGGYGVFGARVAERLAREPDLEIIVAGRREHAARDAAEALQQCSGRMVGHVALDATTTDAAMLSRTGARIVINASGPFQEQDYALARAAIAAGLHYIDLADPRAFVTGISTLDAEASAAGVLVVSGASSVPGLASAVLAAYAGRFARLTSVSHGISPGNSFDPGQATAASIVGAVGQPFDMRIDGRAKIVHGWQGLHRHDFPSLGRRWMGHCDVPDLVLFPARHPGLATARFSAGVEVGLFHLGLWGLSWLVRAGLVRRPQRMAALMLALKRRLWFLGSDAGGMFMTLAGLDAAGQPLRLDWHLEARGGDGPYVPAIASVIVAKKLARGRIGRRGAMPCVELFTLDEFMAEIEDLEIRATDGGTPLYRRVLGRRFHVLPPIVQQLHRVQTTSTWQGEADVERGRSLLSRLAATLARLPASGRGIPLRVSFEPRAGREIWRRHFGSHVFSSVQADAWPWIKERVGPVQLALEPVASAGELRLALREFRVLGLAIPRFLWPKVTTREWQEDDRYRFAVEARLPLAGLLVRYSGWLRPCIDTQREMPSADNGL